MNLSYFPYQLVQRTEAKSATDPKVRKGFLLRMQKQPNQIGYSDFMPWPEFGEKDFKQVLADLESLSNLNQNDLKASLKFVCKELRVAVQNAFLDMRGDLNLESIEQEISKLENNKLLTSERIASGDIAPFKQKYVKLKLGSNYQTILESLMGQGWIGEKVFRLDFNSCLKADEASQAFHWIKENFKSKIQYVEDPCPIDKKVWKELNQIIPVAADWQMDFAEPEVFSFVILKPTRQDYQEVANFCKQKNLQLVVTSSMDHSLGIYWAAKVACYLKSQYPNLVEVSGCDTVSMYQDDLAINPKLDSQDGYIQFDQNFKDQLSHVLNKISWIQIL